MLSIEFKVKGSSDEPYQVKFQKTDQNLSATCTCQAGKNGQWCKHRAEILSKNSSKITSENIDQIETVINWLAGSPLEEAIKDLENAETTKEKADADLKKAKIKLAKIALAKSF